MTVTLRTASQPFSDTQARVTMWRFFIRLLPVWVALLPSTGMVAEETRPSTHAEIDAYCTRSHGSSDSVALFNCKQNERKALNQRTLACVQSAARLKTRSDENKDFVSKCLAAASDTQLVAANVNAQLERGSINYALATDLIDQGKLSAEQLDQLVANQTIPAKPCRVDFEQFSKWRAMDEAFVEVLSIPQSYYRRGEGTDLLRTGADSKAKRSFWSGQCTEQGAQGKGDLFIDYWVGGGLLSRAVWGRIQLQGEMLNGRFEGPTRIVNLPPKHPFSEFANEYAVNQFVQGRPVALIRERNEFVSQCGKSKPATKYLDNLDGTFTDQKNGLTWLRCPLGSYKTDDVAWACAGTPEKLNWESALKRVKGTQLMGYTDWRFPTAQEYQALAPFNCDAGRKLLFGGKLEQFWLASQPAPMTRMHVGGTESYLSNFRLDPDRSDVAIVLVRGSNSPEWSDALASVPRWKQSVESYYRELARQREIDAKNSTSRDSSCLSQEKCYQIVSEREYVRGVQEYQLRCLKGHREEGSIHFDAREKKPWCADSAGECYWGGRIGFAGADEAAARACMFY